jgi:hypothetical protein
MKYEQEQARNGSALASFLLMETENFLQGPADHMLF